MIDANKILSRMLDEVVIRLFDQVGSGKDKGGLPAVGNVRSSLGLTLENLARTGVQAERCIWSRENSMQIEHRRLAVEIKIWSKLSRHEKISLAYSRYPAGVERYERVVWRGDLLHEDIAGMPYQYRTRHGEEAHEDLGDQRVLVIGERMRFLTHAEIAENLGISIREHRSRVETGRRRILTDPEFPLLVELSRGLR